MAFMKFAGYVLEKMTKKPATSGYPFTKKEYPDKTRGHIAIALDSCIFCGICSRKCPTGAITVDKNEKAWSIDRLRCIQCNCCTEVCPKKCLAMEKDYTSPSQGQVKDVFQHARVSDNP